MPRYIDVDALLKQIEIDSDGEPGYYGDTWKFIETIKNMTFVTINDTSDEIKVTKCNHNADNSKKVSSQCNFCSMSICTLKDRPCSRKVVKE